MADSDLPIPDPTRLTTAQFDRAIAAERDYVNGQIAVLGERLDAIDKATELLNETVNRVPTDMTKEITHLRELMIEKVSGLKEAAAEQNKSNTQAIAKSETSMAETVKTNQELTTTKTDALTKGLDELKLQVSRIENLKQGATESRTESRAQISSTSAVVGIAVALLGTLALYFGIHARDGITTPATPTDTGSQFQSFDTRLQVVEQRSTSNEVRIGAIEALDKFLCKTRTPSLAACP